MNRFKKWFRKWGQPIGFISIVTYLNVYGYVFSDRMRVDDEVSSWLVIRIYSTILCSSRTLDLDYEKNGVEVT